MNDHIEIHNLVPKFLEFYKKATTKDIDCEERWELWKKYYNFAAVPPGENGEGIAKKLLNEAWDKYSDYISLIENWEPDESLVLGYLTEVKKVLGYDRAVNFIIIYFVGGFENNPFVAPYDQERIALCLPVECDTSDIILSHELTHIVHSKTANLKSEWERTIGSAILQEGLATRVSKYLVPGKQDEQYIEYTKGWLKSCEAKKKEIVKGILPYLDDSSSEALTKFTFGTGTTGNERELYFVGWEIVKILQKQGITFKQIASIEEKEIPNYLREVFPLLLEEESP
ncbi:DUF2268 domain-containing putative Zn-dependent protease [Sporosarcina sp. ZBG7A]|uniref:DUF2268 domain-containing putative Zn-dependent protease n=1 Tax=Sporosarcina sp. ZBG7A TaxID=1582223 RepID=UPI00057A8C91|nr:DUF2268 domain-containing putative Zn-dependent protease [Sporosarcina sp. ZBG7A]